MNDIRRCFSYTEPSCIQTFDWFIVSSTFNCATRSYRNVNYKSVYIITRKEDWHQITKERGDQQLQWLRVINVGVTCRFPWRGKSLPLIKLTNREDEPIKRKKEKMRKEIEPANRLNHVCKIANERISIRWNYILPPYCIFIMTSHRTHQNSFL